MSSNPQILKEVIFTLDTEDFAPDIVDGRVGFTPGAIQTIKTLDGVVHQDAESGAWQLELTAVLDWDSTRPGLARYLYDNAGDSVAFTFKADTGANSDASPLVAGTVTLVPLPFGGPGNQFATAELVLPIDGTPTLDTTP